jgi:type IV pilus assembly protein PilB
VEFQVDGISQCSVNPKLGRTFDESLRHVVRQDPDVIVLGEIRDASTAESAIQAALTGHKVLTTFHTEDSIGGLLRLMNMNIESFLISSTVVCVIAQRLLRRVCRECSKPSQPEVADLQLLGCSVQSLSGARFAEGEGCATCHFTGYKGRVAVIESLVLSEAVREAILERKTSAYIRRISVESSGLVTLLEDGLVKAARGETTIAEIRRTLPRLSKPRTLQELRRLTGKN